jgi:hypothetical protein
MLLAGLSMIMTGAIVAADYYSLMTGSRPGA